MQSQIKFNQRVPNLRNIKVIHDSGNFEKLNKLQSYFLKKKNTEQQVEIEI